MILFREDFVKHKATIHYTTKNISAIRVAEIYRKMGIKNYAFILALVHEELADVDPHQEDLSSEIKNLIRDEIHRNPFYFYREIVKVPASGGPPVPFEFNRFNTAYLWCNLNDIDSYGEIPRQTGKTTVMGTWAEYLMLVHYENAQVGFFTKGSENQQDMINKMKQLRDALPAWLISKSPKDSDNKESFDYTRMNTELVTKICAADSRRADLIGRGATQPWQLWDEFPHSHNSDISFKAARIATVEAKRRAASFGKRHGINIVSTPGDLDTTEGKYAHSLIDNSVRFTELFFDCKNNTELKETIVSNSPSERVFIKFDYKQLGKDDAWYKDAIKDLSQDLIDREIHGKWRHGTASSVVPPEILKAVNASERDPVYTEESYGLFIRWYVHPGELNQPDRNMLPYIIGGDTSGNVGRDFSSLVMVHPSTLATVATVRCSLSKLTRVSDVLLDLLLKYPKSIYVPERNYNGTYMIDWLMDKLSANKIDPTKRIFNYFIQDYNTESRNLNALNLDDGRVRAKFGFNTGSNSRTFLYSLLIPMLNYAQHKIYDGVITSELSGLVVRNGRIDHREGCHDDSIISWLLCGMLLLTGKNLSLYGIDTGTILSGVTENGKEIHPLAKQRRDAAKERVFDLRDRIAKATNDAMKQSLERELAVEIRAYDGDIDFTEAINADQIKRDAKNKRGKNQDVKPFNLETFKLFGYL